MFRPERTISCTVEYFPSVGWLGLRTGLGLGTLETKNKVISILYSSSVRTKNNTVRLLSR